MSEAPQIRRAVRALLVSPDWEILLMRLALPDPDRIVWLTPGGGLHDAEEALTGLRRELAEETGLRAPRVEREVWTRTVTARVAGREFTQHERYFFVPTPRFEPSAAGMPEEEERDWLQAFRWWSIDAIERSSERFAPRERLSELRRGLPATPIDLG